jgi:two-component system, OmpR family, sensor kinase
VRPDEEPRPDDPLDRRVRPRRSLRVRVPVTAVAILAVSLAVATLLAFQLLLQAGRTDIDVVLDRERERFETAMSTLLAEEIEQLEDEAAEAAADPDAAPVTVDGLTAMQRAARRYLQLNPANESYWTIIRTDGRAPLASANGPDLLEPLFRAGTLPEGELGSRETIRSEVGDLRSSSAPILLGGEEVGSYQIVAPLRPVRDEAFAAAGLLAAAAGVSLVLGAALLTTTLWRSLSPLRTLATTARSTELRRLHARVEQPEDDDEVGLLAREFNAMLERLERASTDQQAFMASISHELRTPITIARGHLEMLRSIGDEDPAAREEAVLVVEDELHRMGRLVEDLMAIARADTEDFARSRDIELVAFFEDLELKIAGLGVPGLRLDPPPPVVLAADPDRLAQAVLNLVNNAHRHTPVGTRIRIRALERRGEVVLEVSDDGPGIPPEIQDRVFEPFVTAGDSAHSTGLGLAVVSAVVHAHGGRIDLDTGPGGTTFRLHLPLTVPSAPLDPDPDPDPGPSDGVGGTHQGGAPEGGTPVGGTHQGGTREDGEVTPPTLRA